MRILAFALVALAFAPVAAAQVDCAPGAHETTTLFFREVGRDALTGFDNWRRRVAYVLDRCPGLGLTVTGLAGPDEPGPDALAERRAAHIEARLVEIGVAPERIAATGGGVATPSAPRDTTARSAQYAVERSRRAELRFAAVDDLPGVAARGPDADPFPLVADLLLDETLRLDWAPRTPADACAGDARGGRRSRFVLRAAHYSGQITRDSLDTTCLGADTALGYTSTATAEPTPGVVALDGRLGEGRSGYGAGWLVGPTGSRVTDGRFCAGYDAAYRAVLDVIADLVPANGDDEADAAESLSPDARGKLVRAAAALMLFVDAVEAVGGEAAGVALDCRPLSEDAFSH